MSATLDTTQGQMLCARLQKFGLVDVSSMCGSYGISLKDRVRGRLDAPAQSLLGAHGLLFEISFPDVEEEAAAKCAGNRNCPATTKCHE